MLREVQDVETSFLEPLAAGLSHRNPKIASATMQFWLRDKVQAAVESLTPPESFTQAFLQAAEVPENAGEHAIMSVRVAPPNRGCQGRPAVLVALPVKCITACAGCLHAALLPPI